IEEDDIQAVVDTLKSGFLVQGKRVQQFEAQVAELTGASHAVAVSNCTAALHLALVALGISYGDLVIVPAYSWLSTANVVELCGATPIFVDVEPDTFNMSVDALKGKLKALMEDADSASRVKAVIPVHVFGQMAKMDAILALCTPYNIPVIEDAACALGSAVAQKQAGTWGTLGCFSFHPRKAITTGEGGIVVTDDQALANQLRALRNHGLDAESASPDFVLAGYNYRMTDLQGALGTTQMQKLERILASRRTCAARYAELLTGSDIAFPQPTNREAHVFQSYVVLLPLAVAPRRADVITALRDKGIQTTIGTYHMPMTRHFREQGNYQTGDFPIADQIAAQALTLPVYEGLSLEEQAFVVSTLLDVVHQFS
ncbi:MAG: DegT/DnrJ/EryC1/StrS family aminotransferase, partial [Cyanobacteria bacterium J06607_10]